MSRVLSLDPDHVNAAFARAACFNAVGQFQRAIEDYNFALLKDNNGGSGRPATPQLWGWGASAGGLGSASEDGLGDFSPSLSPPQGASNDEGNMLVSTPHASRIRPAELFRPMLPPSEAPPTPTAPQPLHRPQPQAQGGTSWRAPVRRLSVDSAATISTEGANAPPVPPRSSTPHRPPPRPVLSAAATQEGNTSGSGSISTQGGPPSQPFERRRRPSSAETGIPGATTASTDTSAVPPNPVGTSNSSTSSNMSAPGHPSLRSSDQASAGQLQASEEAYARGVACRKQHDFQGAVFHYTRAIEANPSSFKALFNRGFVHDKLDAFDLAVDDYCRAIALEPENPFAYFNRGMTYDRRGDHELACADFSHALRLQPQNTDFALYLGHSLRKANRNEDAAQVYKRLIDSGIESFKARLHRGQSLEQLGRSEEALEDFTVALSIQPRSVQVLMARASLFQRQSRFQDALRDLDDALAAQPSGPNSADIRLARASVFEQMNNHKDALLELDRGLEVDPKNAALLSQRGIMHKSMEDYAQAVKDLTDALAGNPPSPSTCLSLRGFCWRKLGRFEDAVGDYSKCIASAKDSQSNASALGGLKSRDASANLVRHYNNRAYCLVRLGRFSDAIADYSAVVELEPSNAHAFHNRGLAYERQGMVDRAASDFAKVAELEVLSQQQHYGQPQPSRSHEASKHGSPTDTSSAQRLSSSHTAWAREDATLTAHKRVHYNISDPSLDTSLQGGLKLGHSQPIPQPSGSVITPGTPHLQQPAGASVGVHSAGSAHRGVDRGIGRDAAGLAAPRAAPMGTISTDVVDVSAVRGSFSNHGNILSPHSPPTRKPNASTSSATTAGSTTAVDTGLVSRTFDIRSVAWDPARVSSALSSVEASIRSVPSPSGVGAGAVRGTSASRVQQRSASPSVSGSKRSPDAGQGATIMRTTGAPGTPLRASSPGAVSRQPPSSSSSNRWSAFAPPSAVPGGRASHENAATPLVPSHRSASPVGSGIGASGSSNNTNFARVPQVSSAAPSSLGSHAAVPRGKFSMY
jgi:tetratricopeptide (TPR) repeat protein